MTAQELIHRLTNDPKKGVTPERIVKLWATAKRLNIPRERILAAASPELRAQLEQ